MEPVTVQRVQVWQIITLLCSVASSHLYPSPFYDSL